MPDPGWFPRVVQAQNFSGGLYRNSSLDRIPANGSQELLNSLLDLQGGTFRRGGSAYRSNATFGAGLRWIWDGYLASGHVTLIASTTDFGRLEPAGGVVNLGEGGLAAPVRIAVYEGKAYFPGGKTYDGTSWGTNAEVGSSVTIAGNRLITAEGSRVKVSKIGKPGEWEAGEYIEIPGGVQVLALEGARDSVAIFTTGGIYVLSGVALKLTDASGNVQWRLDRFSGDIVLWGAAGVAAWQGTLIVPGIDGVWLVQRGVTSEQVENFRRMSDPIRDLYREYVAQGYLPGRAVVFNNHYLLPIIGGGRIIDTLVCRLDLEQSRGQPGAWTHLAGYGAGCAAFASRVGSGTSRESELLGAVYDATSRVLTCAYFSPSESTKTDADGTAPEWVWQPGAYPTGNGVRNLISKIRLRYQLYVEQGSEPKISAEIASEAPPGGSSTWGGFSWGEGTWATSGASSYEMLPGEAPADVTADKPFTWKVRKKRRYVSLRFVCKAASAQLSVKAFELFVRLEGRR